MAIDITDAKNIELLSNIQGNILKGHGRDHATLIFIQFDKEKKDEACKWITQSVVNVVTSAQKQFRQRELYQRKHYRVSNRLFASFYLSSLGYDVLDIKKPAENVSSVSQSDEAFIRGMKDANTRQILKDPEKAEWQKEYQQDIHAMLLLAHDYPDRLHDKAQDFVNAISSFGKVVHTEDGHVLRNSEGKGIEHFGYVDGISQPLFLQDDVNAYNQAQTMPLVWDPEAHIDLVLVQDMPENTNARGSYFVFRKLEQNVKEFKAGVEQLAKQLAGNNPPTPADIKKAGAMVLGRFEDGTPITKSSTDGIVNAATENNFDYDNDLYGAKCPFHGHTRKVNPRGAKTNSTSNGDNPDVTEILHDEKKHRIVRRGIPYGVKAATSADDSQSENLPTNGVGLLFMCYQASIANQFEHIQGIWAGSGRFPKSGTGLDPIIGMKENSFAGWYAKVYGDGNSMKNCNFGKFVTMKGGEYFFAPSIAFLKSLK